MPGRKYLGKATDVFYGAVVYNRANAARPGVKTIAAELAYKNFGAILAAAATAICLSQSINTGTPGVLNGASVSAGVATFPTPRNVVAAWTGAAVLTVTGTDEYGSIMVESSPSGTTFTGKKAFKTVTAVTVSANVTLATVGSGVLIGLPHRVDANSIVLLSMNNAVTTATQAVADVTSPATATTGDVRGTLSFGTAPNGTNTYAVLYKVADPSTKVGTYGVLQFGSTDSA